MPIAVILEPPSDMILFTTLSHFLSPMLVSEVFIRFFLWFTTHQRHEDHEYCPHKSSLEKD